MRIGEVDGRALVESPGQPCNGERLRLAANILTCVIERSTWAVESLFIGREFFWQAHRRHARNGNGSAGNAATAVNHLEPDSISHGVALCLMDFHHNIFLRL